MERRRLLALSTHATSPGQRFRIQTWAPYLAAHGIDTFELAFATKDLERLLPKPGYVTRKMTQTAVSLLRYPLRVPAPSSYDATLVYREAIPLGPTVWERWVGSRPDRPMAFDVDDPIFAPAPTSLNPIARYLRDPHKWRALCRVSAVTICINEMIADYLRPYSSRVVVVPNALDLNKYPIKAMREPDGLPVVGYSGSPSTMAQLSVVREALEIVGEEERYALQVVGGRAPFPLDHARIVEKSWNAANEVQLLHGFDIGIAPAPDDEWSRYKSFVKVLLYMAVGMPVIASPVGLPRYIIKDGVNGFLAKTPGDWTDRLLLLLRDTDLRFRVGRAARETIRESFSLETQLPRVRDLFDWLTRGAVGDTPLSGSARGVA